MDYKDKIDVACSDLGSKVIYCSDEFFADSGRMLQASEPLWIEGKYDENGKWMDGWESRRRRDGKNDFCFINNGSVDLRNIILRRNYEKNYSFSVFTTYAALSQG